VCRTVKPQQIKKYTVLPKYLKTSKINQVSSLCHNCLFLKSLQGYLRLLSACCPLDVRLLSAFKADNKRTSSGQQADNNQCWSGEEAGRNGDVPEQKPIAKARASPQVKALLTLKASTLNNRRSATTCGA